MPCSSVDSVLRFEGFSFRYPGAPEPILSGIDLAVGEGELVVLTGPTGCGKTTLLRSAVAPLAPRGERAGAIRLVDPEGVAYVSQFPAEQIVCDTVWHELAFGLENAGFAPEALRRRVAETARYFGLEELMDERTDRLSGGEQQLLNVASALALRPRVLLLDEPSAQLDPVAAARLAGALFRVVHEAGVSAVVATHDPEALRPYATRILRLDPSGRLLADGGVPAPVRPRHPRGSGREALPATGAPGASAPSAPAPAPAFAPDPNPSEPVAALASAFVAHPSREGCVLRGFSFAVAPGSIHALVGGNGAGKTTALRALAGVRPLVRGRRADRSRRRVLLPQNPLAFVSFDTVAEELAAWQEACGYAEGDIAEAMGRFGLADLGAANPLDLSGGERQLLALAKAALAEPDLLLLDEPAKGLDDALVARVESELMRLRARGCAIALVSHDLDLVARLADEVTLLFDGQDACCEPPERFFADTLFLRTRVPLGGGEAEGGPR